LHTNLGPRARAHTAHTHTHTHTIYIYIIVTEVNKGKGKFVPVAYDGGSIAPRILDLDTMR